MIDYKQLCAELVCIADALDGGTRLISNQGQALDGYSALAAFRALADRARAALAEPKLKSRKQRALDALAQMEDISTGLATEIRQALEELLDD